MKAIFETALQKSHWPICAHTLYRDGVFTATDCEREARTINPILGLQEHALIPVAWLKAIYPKNGQLIYVDGAINGHKIPEHGFKFEDFPSIKGEFVPSARVVVSRDDLAGVALASSVTDIRYYLSGVWFDCAAGRIAATDGHRLHVAGMIDCNKTKGEFIVPSATIRQALSVACKGSDIVVEYDAGEGIEEKDGITNARRFTSVRITFSHDGTVIRSKIINGKYPDIDRVIPADGKANIGISVDAKEGLVAFKQYERLAKANPEQAKVITARFKNGMLNGDATLATDAVSVTGCEGGMGFVVSYVRDAVKFIGSDVVRFGADDVTSCIKAQSGHKVAVVMPCRI
jgi:DNA polymerase-3 subunit beta